jgi:hypothetical protein
MTLTVASLHCVKLPVDIKNTSNNFKKFKVVLRHFLNTHTLYTVDEYLNR